MSGRRGKISILLAIIVTLALLTVSCGESAEPTPMPIPMTLYESTEHGFSIEYPEGWTESEQGMGTYFSISFLNPEETLYAAVSVEYKTENIILADYVTENKEYMESTPDFELISEGDVTIGEGISGYEIVGRGDLGTGEVEKFRFVILVREKQGIAVGAMGEDAVFDQSDDIIDAAVSTFELLSTYSYVPPTPSAGGIYTSAEYGFSATYPAGWTETFTGRTGEIVTFTSGMGLPSVTISQSPVGEGTTLAEYGPQFSQDLGQHWGDYVLISHGEITLDDGTPAYEIVFTGTMEGYNLKCKYVVVIQGAQAFYIAGLSMPASFEQDEEVLNDVIYSFNLE
jgi:hypothetical protein